MDKGKEMEKHQTSLRDSEGDEEAPPLLRDTSPDSCRLLLRNQQHSPLGTIIWVLAEDGL